MTTWVLIYASAAGVDVSCYATRADAVRAGLVIMLSRLDRLTQSEVVRAVLGYVAEHKFETALHVYSRVAGESFEIDAKPIVTVDESSVDHVRTIAFQANRIHLGVGDA